MNITETKRQIAIALNQAHISENKMNWYKNASNVKTAEVYEVRMKSLRNYAQKLNEQLRNHERKQYKKVNN